MTNQCSGSQATNTKPYVKKTWERVRQPITEYGESRTDTSFGNDTDINKIVERFARTGQMPPPPTPKEAAYADVTNLQQDLTVLLDQTRNAKEQLETIRREQQQLQQEKLQNDAKELETLRQRYAQEQEEPTPNP